LVAAGNDIAASAQWTKVKSDQLTEHKKDQEYEFISDQDSRADDGVRQIPRLGRFVNDGTLAFTDTAVAA
jgi:hypothetical protein